MSSDAIKQEIKKAVNSHPNFPKEGVVFRDFLPILQNPELFAGLLTLFQDFVKENIPDVQCIAGIESRGFLIGPALALKLKVPFITLRKPGKLPGEVKKEVYTLEYGTDAVEIQINVIQAGQKVVIVDDLIATGGSMAASVKLIESIGGVVEHCLSVIELPDLKGKEKIPAPTYSLFQF